jgi:hypothetical protein
MNLAFAAAVHESAVGSADLGALFLFDHPADQRSSAEAHGKSGRHSQHRVSLDALSCVIQEFFRGVAAPFCGTPHDSDPILDGIGNRAGCARSLVARLSHTLTCSIHYVL